MWKDLEHKELYLLVAVLGLFIGVTALGGGLFGQTAPWYTQWQHKLFAGLCHQDPQRSFWLNEIPMAVCSRCLGVYTSFAALWLLFPLRSEWVKPLETYGKKILLAVVLLNVADVVGNSLEIWDNTLPSRYLMGTIIGISAAGVLLCGFTGNQQQN